MHTCVHSADERLREAKGLVYSSGPEEQNWDSKPALLAPNFCSFLHSLMHPYFLRPLTLGHLHGKLLGRPCGCPSMCPGPGPEWTPSPKCLCMKMLPVVVLP